MFGLFNKKQSFKNPLAVDIHSHLIPAVDDGSKSVEESMAILREFRQLGYKKVITTPHIMKEYYDNDIHSIQPQYELLMQRLSDENLGIELEFAAEYHMDEFFIDKVNKNEKLLTFGDQYVLIETSFFNAPVFLKDVFFSLKTKGYSPIFAHPERYMYLIQNFELAKELKNMQVLFQINAPSLIGSYGKPVKKLAEKLLENDMVEFVASDCHNLGHIESLKKTIESKSFQKLPFDKLLNNTLK